MKRTLGAAMAAMTLAAAGPALALNICVEGAYPPFSETSPDGSLVGFDIDMANALCAEMGETCDMMKTDWDGIIPALLEKKCDAIVASMSITPERMEVIDFTKKYYQTPAVLAAAEDADFEGTAEGLAGKVIGVQRGTIHETYAIQYFPDAEIRGYGSQDEAFLDLIAGRLDAVMADSIAVSQGFPRDRTGRRLRLPRRHSLRPRDPRRGRGNRGAQGGYRIARPVDCRHRSHSRRRDLRGNIEPVLRLRRLR